MNITAELCVLGDSRDWDIEGFPKGTPRVIFQRDGKQLMLIGLSQDECRALVPLLFQDVKISVEVVE